MKKITTRLTIMSFMVLAFLLNSCTKEYADPSMTFIPNVTSSENVIGEAVSFNINLFAEAGLASLEINKNGYEFDSRTFDKSELNLLYSFSYTVEDDLEEGELVEFEFILVDQQDKSVKTNYSIQVSSNPVPVKVVTDKNSSGIGTTTWDRDTVYILDGFCFVNDGQVLTIEPGTIIKGKTGQAEDASALIVARGGKIFAEGTASAPIIFTAESDNIRPGEMMGSSLEPSTNGLWGGLIILGKSITNNTTSDKAIEGIPTSETRGQYGGNDDTDNSGILKYISIRHGGTLIGAENEINGLTLGAVGSGTTIEYIEIFGNADDGIEFFGSTVNTKYIISAYNNDDSFDYDESYRGKGQFWFVLQDPNVGDRVGEHDGGPSDNEFGDPYAIPEIYNVTYIGRGAEAGTRLITFRDNAGGKYFNSIFLNQAKGIDIEYIEGSDDSYLQFSNGNLEIGNNIFWNIADGTAGKLFTVVPAKDSYTVPAEYLSTFEAYFTTAGNTVSDPGVQSDNPVPTGTVTGNMHAYPGEWFEQVNYKGAFAPGSSNWAKGWTLLDNAGLLK